MSLYSRGQARRSAIDTVSYRMVSQLATMLSYVVMVRGMSHQDFGVLNLLYAFIPLVSTVASLGLEQTLRRYQPEYLQNGNEAAARWLVRFVASARFGTSVIVLGAVLLTWNTAAPWFKLTPYRAEFALFSLLVLLYFQTRILQLSLAARMLHRLSVGSLTVLSTVKLIGYGLLVWQDSLTLDRAILVDTTGFAIVYVVLRIAYRRHVPPSNFSAKYRPDKEERRRLGRYAFYNNFNDAGSMILNSKSDNFFIAALIDPVAVGVYGFFTRLNEMTQHVLPVRLFDRVLQPLLFALPKDVADKRMPKYFTLLVNMNLLFQWPILAAAVAFHQEILHVVFGGKFAQDSWLLPVVAGFSTLNVIATPVTLVAQYEEKAVVILLSKITIIYNVIALLVLLPILGVYGAAIASGSAQVLKSCVIWWHVRTNARWCNAGRSVIASVSLWGAAVALCYGIKHVIGDRPVINLAIGALILLAASFVQLRGPAVADSDRVILGSVFRGREATILTRIGLLKRARAETDAGVGEGRD